MSSPDDYPSAVASALPQRFKQPRFLEQIIDAVADPIFVKDEQHRWILLNQAFCQFMGHRREDLLGKSDYDFFPKEEADVFWAKDAEVFSTGKTNINEEDFTDADGVLHTIVTKKSVFKDEQGHKILVGSIRDVTEVKAAQRALLTAHEELEARVEQRTAEVKQAQELLLHSQKMDAVGKLAGGIAHDFNNLLAAIVGSLETIALGQVGDEQREELTSTALDAARSGSTLTQRMLAFSRQQALRPQPTELSSLLKGVEVLLRSSLEASIAISVELEETPLLAYVDRGQLETALLNLCINAREAMPDGGRLDVRVRPVDLEAIQTGELGDLGAGPYVLIEVTDDGHGMTADVQSRAFEPFFTTREEGRGTGLGLSMVYGFAVQSCGAITMESEPGVGTSFRLYLPRVRETPDADIEAPPRPILGVNTGRVVLVVDDDARVRTVTMRALSALGYISHGAANAAEAYAAADRLEHIDALLTDMVLGYKERGDTIARELCKRYPHLKVLYMSGYADEQVRTRIADDRVSILQKPFWLADLDTAVQRLWADGAEG